MADELKNDAFVNVVDSYDKFPITNVEQELLLSTLDSLQRDRSFINQFNLLMTVMYRTARLKGWHTPSKSFGEEVVMMHSELSEVIEAFREETGNYTDIWYDAEKNNKPEGVPIELADLAIREFDTSVHRGIDLLEGIFIKGRFNLTRPERHGNKKL